MPEKVSKTSKTGHFGVLRRKSSERCLNCGKITQSNCQEEEKRMIKYMLFVSFTNGHIFFNMNNYQNLSGKSEKISQYFLGSAPPSCFGTGRATVLSTRPRKTE